MSLDLYEPKYFALHAKLNSNLNTTSAHAPLVEIYFLILYAEQPIEHHNFIRNQLPTKSYIEFGRPLTKYVGE